MILRVSEGGGFLPRHRLDVLLSRDVRSPGLPSRNADTPCVPVGEARIGLPRAGWSKRGASLKRDFFEIHSGSTFVAFWLLLLPETQSMLSLPISQKENLSRIRR